MEGITFNMVDRQLITRERESLKIYFKYSVEQFRNLVKNLSTKKQED